jgi:pantoate--beta-alanine ligase
VAAHIGQGRRDYPQLLDEAKQTIAKAGFVPEYLEIRHALTLRPASAEDRDLVILVAANLGTTRLIDNLHLDLDHEPQNG